MKTLPADLEALMPEPIGYLTDWPAIGGGLRKLFGPTRTAGDALAFKVDPLFTADKVRDAMLAAHSNALDLAYTAMFDLKGDKVTRFDAQTAIRKLKDAAAIRSGGEGCHGKA